MEQEKLVSHEVAQPRSRIKSYEAWRGIAAVMILFSHMSYLSEAVNPFWNRLWNHFMCYGSYVCSFFFLCSGFLLAYTWKEQSFGTYIKKKLKRIYPLTLLVFLLALALDLVLSNDVITEGVTTFSPLWFVSVASNLLLVKAFIPLRSVYFSFHGPSWYVSVLMVFYVVGFWFVRGLHREESKRCKWHRAVLIVAVLTYLAQFALSVLVKLNGWNANYLLYICPWFRIFGEGFVGILLCEYCVGLRVSDRSASVLEVVAVVLFIASFTLKKWITIGLPLWSSWLQIIPMGAVLIAFRRDKGIVSHVLAKRPWQFLGKISFELYMTHAFVYNGLPIAVGIVSKTMRNWLVFHAGTRFVITFILCILIAWIVHLCIERFNNKALAKL